MECADGSYSSRQQPGKQMLAAIDAPHFYAGIVLKSDIVTEAAPILKYMSGWSRDKVRSYCQRKGWKVTVVRNVL